MTTYRLIIVWRDEEQDNDPIQRRAKDFTTREEAEAHISFAQGRGIMRIDCNEPPMENGINLLTICVPFHQIISWYIWLIPDGVSWEVQA